MKLTTKIFIGLILGITVGLFLTDNPEFALTYIKPVGTLFISLIKMIIVPLVLSSLIVGAAGIGDAKTLGRIGGKTLGYYMVTTAFAVSIGLFFGYVLNPGVGVNVVTDAVATSKDAPSLIDTIVNIVPKNPIKGIVDVNMLQIITFALFLGMGATAVGEKAKGFVNFFEGLAEIMYKITAFIMTLAPIGVFGLIAPVVAKNGPDVLIPLLKVIIAVYIGCIVHVLFVYTPAVKIFAKTSPLKFLKGVMPAALTAFSTSSSSGTLPVSIKCVRENLKVSEKISSFVLPLGATINMDGTALYQGVCALFVAQFYGIDLSAGQYATIILTATLGSIGTAGVPGAGLIMLTIVLNSVGLPIEGIALIAGIDRILDMARTSLNVIGDTSAALIVAASEGEILNEETLTNAKAKAQTQTA